MSPARQGGRPKNAWTSSRRRKLVRLYTLTTLNKDEIQKVLKANDFNPSSSDVQKKLRSLLPRDYATDYRKFRPSDDGNMRARLSQIRRRRSCRVSKYMTRGPHRMNAPTQQQRKLHSDLPHQSKDVYATSTASGSNTIAPYLLNMSSEKSFQGGVISEADPVPATRPMDCIKDTGQIRQSRYSQDTPSPNPDYDQTPSQSASLRSLRRRLGDKHPQPYMEHVNSVLRYSSTNSWRSSLLSITSCVSSQKSVKSESGRRLDIENEATQTSTNVGVLGNVGLPLSNGERIVWNELVDESQLVTSSPQRPPYHDISLTKRPCCDLVADTYSVWPQILPSCTKCGFSTPHHLAIICEPGSNGWGIFSLNDDYNVERNAYMKDYFGNTPIHFLAASGKANSLKLFSLIGAGANIHEKNTSGQTFMHVLRFDKFLPDGALEPYLGLLRYLSLGDFDVLQRDYHGRTIAWNFFQNTKGVMSKDKISQTTMGKIFSTLKLDLTTRDSNGDCLENVFESWMESFTLAEAVSISLLSNQQATESPGGDTFTFTSQPQFNEGVLRGGVDELLQVLEPLGPLTWIDANGDTMLSAILKMWPHDGDELVLKDVVLKFIEMGSEIHMRDREGDTLLSIACRRGFRPVVITLLDSGANFHSRDYRGRSVLAQSRKCFLEEKTYGSDKSYSKILSCMNAVIDAGAKLDPTEVDEWSFSKSQSLRA